MLVYPLLTLLDMSKHMIQTQTLKTKRDLLVKTPKHMVVKALESCIWSLDIGQVVDFSMRGVHASCVWLALILNLLLMIRAQVILTTHTRKQ